MLSAVKDKVKLIYIFTCCIALIIVVLRAFFIPFSHDEAATFFFYVQSGNYLPYKAFLYTNNHVLNSALTHIFYELAGSHRFILRLPNIISFLVLCVAVFRFFRHFQSLAAKIILTFLLILNIHFLDFFELCRGYGISMAFLTLSLSYLLDYFQNKKLKSYIWFSVFIQLALAANLTLIVPLALLIAGIALFQLKEKIFFIRGSLFMLGINFLILYFWLKFALHYKEHGLLDSGAPENYWKTTFLSLILLVFGSDRLWIQITTLVAFLFSAVSAGFFFLNIKQQAKVFSGNVLFIAFIFILIISFFALNKIAGVNFPEDRTVLFLYVLFSLAFSFAVETTHAYLKRLLTTSVAVFISVQFILFFNLQTFCHYFYHVTPKSFYSYLEKEFLSDQQIFTVGGHPAREMVYTFANYRGSSLLNPMDEPKQMHMNCDYYVALKYEEPFYKHFYDEVLIDKYWNRALLKRRDKIKRTAIYYTDKKNYSGNDEFIEFLRIGDSAFTTRNCIEADIELSFNQVPAPLNAWVTLEIVDENEKNIYYKRVQLNWIADNLNGQTKRFRLTSGPLPKRFKRVLVYIWNVDKQNIDVSLSELTLFELNAKGINFVIPEWYYNMSKQLTDKVLL